MIKEIIDIFTYSSIIFITLFIVGFIKSPPNVFLTFTFFIKIFLAFILIYKFGYKKSSTFTELDRRIIIMISIFMLVMSFTEFINQFIYKIKHFINPDNTKEQDVSWF